MRNLLVNKIIRLFTMQTSLSTIRTVAHNLKITAILKLPKLALCPHYDTASGARGDYHSTPGLRVIGYFPNLPMKGKTSNQRNVSFSGSLYWSRPTVISKCPLAGWARYVPNNLSHHGKLKPRLLLVSQRIVE